MPPPVASGSTANAAFGNVCGVVVVVTKGVPLCTAVTVQPEGKFGAVTVSKLSYAVAEGCPIASCFVNEE